jgi:microcystin-dependent protein
VLTGVLPSATVSDVEFVTPGAPIEAIWGNDVVQALKNLQSVIDAAIPIGMVVMYGGNVEPSGWFFCNGANKNKTTYSTLYARIGDNFARGRPAPPAGDFWLPDMRARYPVGHNAGGAGPSGPYWTVGVGEASGTYTPSLVAHQHGGGVHGHTYSGGTGGASVRHTHGFYEGYFLHQTANPAFYVHVTGGGGYDIAADIFNFATWGTNVDQQDHAHGFSGGTDAAGIATDFRGDGAAQIPPGVAYNFIIRAL